MQKKPATPALSHMLIFFVIPAVAFMIFAAVKLFGAFLHPKPQDVFTKLDEIKHARSSNERWQSAYILSQGLQQMIRDGEIKKLPPERKELLFASLEDLLSAGASDARLGRYILMTLGQTGEARALPALERGLAEKDAELRFFSAWGYIDILAKNPAEARPERLQRVASLLSDSDPGLRKIASTYLVQKGGDWLPAVEKLLSDGDREVRWNAAVAMGSVGERAAAPVLTEIFNLQNLRASELHDFEDMKRLVAAAISAARKLNDAGVLRAADELRRAVKADSPEGRAILSALQ